MPLITEPIDAAQADELTRSTQAETFTQAISDLDFAGLKDGDNWCVCASWVGKAIDAGKGCSVYLKKTHENTLKIVPIEKLKKLAIDLS